MSKRVTHQMDLMTLEIKSCVVFPSLDMTYQEKILKTCNLGKSLLKFLQDLSRNNQDLPRLNQNLEQRLLKNHAADYTCQDLSRYSTLFSMVAWSITKKH